MGRTAEEMQEPWGRRSPSLMAGPQPGGEKKDPNKTTQQWGREKQGNARLC